MPETKPEAKHDIVKPATRRTLQRPPLLLALLVAGAVALLAAVSAQGAPAPARWIVFAATPPGAPVNQLFRVHPSGTGLSQITSAKLPSTAPVFSPDGKRIAFVRGSVGILTMNPDGTGVRRLTSNVRDAYPTWSPDGKQLAFVRAVGQQWRVHVISASGTGLRRLPKGPPSGRPNWTTRGLLIPTAGDLARIDATTGRVEKYYEAEIDPVWGLNSVVVSPNGSTVTFVGQRSADPGDSDCGEGPCQRFALYIEDVLTAKSPRLYAPDVGPATFSPDGKSLAFAAQGALVIRSIASGSSKLISTGTAYISVVSPPAWQPR